ncbi:MAG: PIG-L family deacetylase [Chloroflexi bacterium]|nr:MAG: PIG-L family deacetylase [Chloroflexota bacterium]
MGVSPADVVAARAVLTVCAHPDDESFGLGALVTAFADAGMSVSGISFTHGEASTLSGSRSGLETVRMAELAAAARALRMTDVELLHYPDGRLIEVPVEDLATIVVRRAQKTQSDALLVFDDGGVTGHPDHQQATDAALRAAEILDLPVLAWAIPEWIAATLNSDFGTGFVGRTRPELDAAFEVSRDRQLLAIGCHVSQSTANPVLWRRLELLGDIEVVRWLRHAGDHATQTGATVAAGLGPAKDDEPSSTADR